MTPIKIISGGQTGADIAGLRAAKRFNLETGGWMPKGWITEAGPKPEYREMYGMQETDNSSYPERTQRNVSASNATLFFGAKSSGFGATYWACTSQRRPLLYISSQEYVSPARACSWLEIEKATIINIAGNRESKAPGIGAWVEEYLCEVFRMMGFQEKGVSK